MKGFVQFLEEEMLIKEIQIKKLTNDLEKVNSDYEELKVASDNASSEAESLRRKLSETELALNETKSENNKLKERIAQAELALVDLYESSLNPEVVSSVDDNGK